MRAQKLGTLHPIRPLHRFCALPKSNRQPRIITRLGHHHQAHIIRLYLLLPPHGQVAQECHQVEIAEKSPECKEPRSIGPREEVGQTTCCEVDKPRGGHALRSMRGRSMGDFVAQNRSEGIFAAAHGNEATIDDDFPAWVHKRIDNYFSAANKR